MSRAPARDADAVQPDKAAAGPGLRIVVDDLSSPQIVAFIEEHIRQMRSISPPESKHALDVEGLRRPEITFWSVMDGDTVVGCGALKRLDARHGEVKSMRIATARRRSGIASLLLAHLISEARRMGFARLSLETGAAEFFLPARRLYEKFGFTECAPFADYHADPNSVFMTLPLDPAADPESPDATPPRGLRLPSPPKLPAPEPGACG